ncbi:hypothetical protein D9M71_587610 [compost metagenome]
MAERLEQRKALLQVEGLGCGVVPQQAQQMPNRLIGGVQVQVHILLDSTEQLFAARKNDLSGLPVVENAQHDPGQQQQESEHHADMNVQGKSPLIRAQWAGHAGHSVMVNTLLRVQA